MSDRKADGVALLTRPQFFSLHTGLSPVIATAIHDGHFVDGSVANFMGLDGLSRHREEDPHTGFIIGGVPNRLISHRSRFALDLNRARDRAVYLTPDECWGLSVWNRDLPADLVADLRVAHDEYYLVLQAVLEGLVRRYGRFVVLDVHSYNHRRDGPDAPPSSAEVAPDINIGTYSMDRTKWAHVVDPFMDALRSHRVQGRFLDVRENIAFEGRGEQTRFIHAAFPEAGCAIAVEFKKFFMDEWTGEPNQACLTDLRQIISESVPVLEAALAEGSP